MTEHSLTLRPTRIAGDRIEDDFGVYFEGRSVGRIRDAGERVGHNVGWDWHVNPPLPIPPWANGSAETLEEAKAVFREAWGRFHATLTPHAIKLWHDLVAGLRERERERDRGKPPPPHSSMMRCVCGVEFDSHKPDQSYDHRGHIYAAQAKSVRW